MFGVITAEGTGIQEQLDELMGAHGAVGSDPNKRHAKVIKNRKMITSMRRTLIVAVKVMLLFAGAAVYFAVSFSLEYNEFNRQKVSMTEQAYAARRNALLSDSGVVLRDFNLAAFRPNIFRPVSFARSGGKLLKWLCQSKRTDQHLICVTFNVCALLFRFLQATTRPAEPLSAGITVW